MQHKISIRRCVNQSQRGNSGDQLDALEQLMAAGLVQFAVQVDGRLENPNTKK